MKHPSTPTKAMRSLYKIYAAVVLLFLSGSVFSQPAPPGPGGSGGNIDPTPLGVPFDDNLNLILVLVGVVFAVVLIVKKQKQKKAALLYSKK